MIKKYLLSCLVIASLGTTTGVLAEAPAGAQACSSCHGAKGVSMNPQWPNLAGQNAGYLRAQITAFRDGVRSNPVMAPFVSGLSDGDIEALARWFSQQKPARAANGDTRLVARGEQLSAYCIGCHGMEGRPVANEWPILNGQHAAYLQNQLAMFKSGERKNSHMQAAVARLGDAEFAALAAYYSQREPR